MKRFRHLFGPPGEQGAIAPIVALGLMAFVGFLALGVDLGQLYVVRNELQNVADAAALAAAKKLIQEDPANPGEAKVYCDEAVTAAITVAAQNRSLGASDPLKVTAADVTIGQWDLTTKSFVRTGCSTIPSQANAVQVIVKRTGVDNPRVTTFLGGVMGAGSQQDSQALATALMGNAGTSSIDPPLAVPPTWASGDGPTGLTSNGLHRLLDKFGPAPAYAALPKTYKFYDKGGSTLDTTRAIFVVPTSEELSLTYMQKYIKGPDTTGGLRFPQKKVGDKLYPISEYRWGSNIKSNYTLLRTRYNAKKDATGKWRVTVPVYSVNPVTASLPQDSWFRLASRLLPGVSQAHACAAYTTPAVYTQGFLTVDITKVYVKSDCLTSVDQVTNSNSCRNTCYAEIKPVNQNTLSTDKGSNPTPYQKDYKAMNPSASEGVGVFSAAPVIVK